VFPDTYHPLFVTEVQLPIFENQIDHLTFLSENTLLVVTYCYTTLLPPMTGLLCTMRPLLTLLLPDSLLL